MFGTPFVKHTKYPSSVQHVSLEVRVKGLGLGSVRYSCGGYGDGQLGIVLGPRIKVS